MTVTLSFFWGVLAYNVGNGNLICEISMLVGTKSGLNITQNSKGHKGRKPAGGTKLVLCFSQY